MLVWMFCNAALVAVVLNAGGLARLEVGPTTSVTETESAKVKAYLLIVLWSVAALSGFKFVGAMWYKVHRIVSSSLISSPKESLLIYFEVRTLDRLMRILGRMIILNDNVR